MHKRDESGFTIVELLIAIVIMGILAGLIMNTFRTAQDRARIGTAEDTVAKIKRGIIALRVDTDKWPNGCPPGVVSNPEADIEDAESGLTQTPPVGVVDGACEWTAADVSQWQGPYWSDASLLDPWGNSYQFDPDYTPWSNCGSIASQPDLAAIVSYGEDGAWYTCDDIYLVVEQ